MTLAEFLEGLSEEARGHENNGRSHLLVPAPLRAEVAELLGGQPITVEGAGEPSDPDIMVGFTPDSIVTAFWTPGMTETQLESYQTLREDGMRPEEARKTIEALDALDGETP